MTVAELIEKLKGLPQDLPVVVEGAFACGDCGGCSEPEEATYICVERNSGIKVLPLQYLRIGT